MRYTADLGCRNRGIPHDLHIIHETVRTKWERCSLCGIRKRYNKGWRGRMKNTEYLRDHVRNFAQPHGPTKRIFRKIYQPETTIITV